MISNIDLEQLNPVLFSTLYKVDGFKIYKAAIRDKVVYLFCELTSKKGICPKCGKISKSVRSYYIRTLNDLSIASNKVILYLKTRKFICKHDKCPQRIFSEQNNILTSKYSRKTNRVCKLLQQLCVEVSSRKGMYISKLFNITQSSSTCLRLVKSMNIEDPITNPNCIGIDDWAKRKGQNYGTIIVNCDTGKPIDLIDSRDNIDLAKRLISFKGVSFVTRDRASGYSRAIKESLGDVKQIADKFHLVKNLGDYIYKEIVYQYRKIKKGYIEKFSKAEVLAIKQPEANACDDNCNEFTKYINPIRQEIFNLVKTLIDKGVSQYKIAKMLNIHRNTVKKYSTVDKLEPKRSLYASSYKSFLPFVNECIERQISRKKIFELLKQNGYSGCTSTFYSWFSREFPQYNCRQELEKELIISEYSEPAEVRFNKITHRRLSIYVNSHLWGVNKDTGECSTDHILASEIIESSDLLKTMKELMKSFKEILKTGKDYSLDTWIERAKDSNISSIKTFVNGINRDKEAVINAIRYKWTNGVVEGNVNRLKNKKREMYGRAGFELLRRKVCLSVTG